MKNVDSGFRNTQFPGKGGAGSIYDSILLPFLGTTSICKVGLSGVL